MSRDTNRPSHHANSTGTLFQNPWDAVEEPSNYRPWELPPGMLNFPIEWAQEHPDHPHKPVEVVKPDFALDSTDFSAVKATWLGHASFLLELPRESQEDTPIRILYDPVFSDRAGPSVYAGIKRRLPPPCEIKDLPKFQYVVYSHNHYDHLDHPSLMSIMEQRGTSVHFVVPLGNKSWLLSCGISEDQVSELDWWEEVILPSDASGQQVKFACCPAQHSSGRGIMDKRTSLWASWVVETTLKIPNESDPRVAVYHAGDTGYITAKGPCPIFDEIGEKYGPLHLAMLPIWRGGSMSFIARMGLKLTADHPLVASLHATPSQAVSIHRAIRSRHSLAMHFATFAGSDVEAFDPIVQLTQARKEVDVGEWYDENGFGVIDVGETALVSTT